MIPARIAGIRFSLWSPAEIRKYSAVEVVDDDTYDKAGAFVEGGLLDPRMGTIEPGQKCKTCGGRPISCMGHFGHIELAEPVIHVAFVDKIRRLILATCRSCSRIKEVGKDGRAVEGAEKCSHCGTDARPLVFEKPYKFTEDAGDHDIRLLPREIQGRLSRIPDEDLRLLGLDPDTARPEWFILDVLPVPPVSVRPSITLGTGLRTENDLTHKLVDVIRVNRRIAAARQAGTPPMIQEDQMNLLQYHVTCYFDNETTGQPQAQHKSGAPIKGITQRLKGKDGRFRETLSGKRVNFSGRSVISPDPNISISEVGVPVQVAKKLTVPEVVTEWNIERIRGMVRNGNAEYPGVTHITRPDGVRINAGFIDDLDMLAEKMAPGYVVDRHMVDGDIVLFNRQPSLHQMSIMAHHARILPGRTFRMHPSDCPPYNADFDGDEMNMHVPQSEEARAEAILLMRIQEQLFSPRYGGPIIGAQRDFVTGAYILTKEDTTIEPALFANLAMLGGYEGPMPEPRAGRLYTGRQLFSLFLPPGFNYTLTSKWSKGTGGGEDDVVIRDGELVGGVIDKTSIGAEEPESVLHRIAKDYGNETGRKFLDSILIVIKQFITHYGFSYGFGDLVISDDDKKAILDGISESYGRVAKMIEDCRAGSLEPIKGMSAEESLEKYIVSELGKAREAAGSLVNGLFDDGNAGKIMATTGARGSSLNVGQMAGSVGQQSRRGSRLHDGYPGRALTHYEPDDDNPDAHGFVKTCYREGLSLPEFFFHAMGGREGLVDTAVRTAKSGYLQRRLVNALEHIKLEYDGTVRDPHGHIIQFEYGEDGIEVAKSDHGEAFNIQRQIESQKAADKGTAATPERAEKIAARYVNLYSPRLAGIVTGAIKKSGLSAAGIEAVCKKCQGLYHRARAEPGQAVGMVTAQSIGEPGTQMTLRTFHFAGIQERNVTLGLPRLIEIVDARKTPNTPTMDIRLVPEKANDSDEAVRIAKLIREVRVGSVASSIDTSEPGTVVVHLDRAALDEYGVAPAAVEEALSTAKNGAVLDGLDVTVMLDGEHDAATTITAGSKMAAVQLAGITGIERASIVKEEDGYVIQTTGSNLAGVLEVEGVDRQKVASNSLFEVYDVLGVEAARGLIISELLATLEGQGLEVDSRHIMLVADLMCSSGRIRQIGRHGIVKAKKSILARSAYEITVPTIADAAVSGEVEDLRGMAENVIVGGRIPVGSGIVDLYMASGEGYKARGTGDGGADGGGDGRVDGDGGQPDGAEGEADGEKAGADNGICQSGGAVDGGEADGEKAGAETCICQSDNA